MVLDVRLRAQEDTLREEAPYVLHGHLTHTAELHQLPTTVQHRPILVHLLPNLLTLDTKPLVAIHRRLEE